MKFSDLHAALPNAHAMWIDMKPHAPGMSMGYLRIGIEEQGKQTHGFPATVDHYAVRPGNTNDSRR